MSSKTRLMVSTKASSSAIPRSEITTMPVDIGHFSKMPNKLFGSGTVARLGPSASLLFLALCEHANQESDNSFRVSDRTLAADTGLSARTLCDARKLLIEQKLVSCSRERGSSHTYTLPKYELPWVPIKDRLRPKGQARGLHQKRRIAVANFATRQSMNTGRVC